MVNLAVSPEIRAGLPFAESMRDRIEAIITSGHCVVKGETVAALDTLSQLYQGNGFQPLWQDRALAEALLAALRDAEQEGLDPGDYHLNIISALLADPENSPVDAAGRDLLFSDAFFRLATHFRFGRVDPESLFPNWNFARDFGDVDIKSQLLDSVRNRDVAGTLRSLLPQTRYYRALRDELKTYREYRDAGGWDPLPEGPLLKPGDRGPQVRLLRERLQICGESQLAGSPDPEFYDEQLRQSVIRFQSRFGQHPDGIVGPDTRNAFNISAKDRIDQIRVNMERLRWVSHSLPNEYLLVNIAGYHVELHRDNEVIWSSRVVVGRTYRETPVFRADMRYLVINPTWTVPPIILKRDLLPRLRKDPGYLQQKHFDLLDLSGNPVDPDRVDWPNMGDRFPYLLRQRPGPDNALGTIKFMFPNAHAVYLHDTPSRSLFAKTHRAFSSGCIRVDRPLELAELLLQKTDASWTRQRLESAIATGHSKTVGLAEHIPVLVMYFTVDIPEREPIRFHNDLYGRDIKVLEALNNEPAFPSPEKIGG